MMHHPRCFSLLLYFFFGKTRREARERSRNTPVAELRIFVRFFLGSRVRVIFPCYFFMAGHVAVIS